MDQVLFDNEALAYFIQFLDCLGAKHLVKFWLDAQSFRTAAKCCTCNSDTPTSTEDTVGTNGASAAEDTRHLDDRGLVNGASKSEICDKSDLNCDKANNVCNCEHRTLKTEGETHRRNICDDAVRIYQKYLSKEAIPNININEKTRGHIVDAICVNKLIDADCFLEAQQEVRKIVEKE